MSHFECWWLSQGRFKTCDERLEARRGWDQAFGESLARMIQDIQEGFEYNPKPFKYHSATPFGIAHNAAMDLLAKILNEGDYPAHP